MTDGDLLNSWENIPNRDLIFVVCLNDADPELETHITAGQWWCAPLIPALRESVVGRSL